MPMAPSSKPGRVEVRDGRLDVHHDPRVGEALEQRQHLLEVVVGRGAAARPVEERRRDGVVAGVGEPPGDVLDVVVHPERLLDHDHRPPRAAVRHRLVRGHRPVGGLQGQLVDLHAGVATTRAPARYRPHGGGRGGRQCGAGEPRLRRGRTRPRRAARDRHRRRWSPRSPRCSTCRPAGRADRGAGRVRGLVGRRRGRRPAGGRARPRLAMTTDPRPRVRDRDHRGGDDDHAAAVDHDATTDHDDDHRGRRPALRRAGPAGLAAQREHLADGPWSTSRREPCSITDLPFDDPYSTRIGDGRRSQDQVTSSLVSHRHGRSSCRDLVRVPDETLAAGSGPALVRRLPGRRHGGLRPVRWSRRGTSAGRRFSRCG